MPDHVHQPISAFSTTFLDVGVSGICHTALTRVVNRCSCYYKLFLEDEASGILIIFPASLLTFPWGGRWYSSASP